MSIKTNLGSILVMIMLCAFLPINSYANDQFIPDGDFGSDQINISSTLKFGTKKGVDYFLYYGDYRTYAEIWPTGMNIDSEEYRRLKSVWEVTCTQDPMTDDVVCIGALEYLVIVSASQKDGNRLLFVSGRLQDDDIYTEYTASNHTMLRIDGGKVHSSNSYLGSFTDQSSSLIIDKLKNGSKLLVRVEDEIGETHDASYTIYNLKTVLEYIDWAMSSRGK